MGAHYFGGKLEKTKRFLLGEMLGRITRHLLLMTATPHSGKEEDFQLFLTLLDRDRFEGKNTTTCTGYIALQLYVPRVMADPVSRKQRRTSLTYCNEGFNLTATRGEMQAEINEKVRYLAAECINTYVQSEVVG